MLGHNHSFIFFSLVLLVLLAAGGYVYFYKYTPSINIYWEEASIKATTNWGSCPPSFPCYETYSLNTEGITFHNEIQDGKLSKAKTDHFVQKTYNLAINDTCSPFYEDKVSQTYELRIDNKTYNFGGKRGCEEMQDLMKAFLESINI